VTRPKQYEQERRSTAVRLPVALHDRLRAAAADRQVSVNLLVEHAIAQYLDRLPPVETVAAGR
jgi:predicted HicB family RNase H-like nuclease